MDLSDAATKEYVDITKSSLSTSISNLISAMYNDLEMIETDETISGLN